MIVGVFLLLWVLVVSVWVYNNYRRNYMNADLFHKFSTSILIFKLLNITASFIKGLNCPIEERMTAEFLDLFFKQTRSLYETSFFAYLLLVSKGWILVLNAMDRKEFNYLVIIIILIYIFDSAVNIISLGMQEITLLLYLIVISHILLFGARTIKAIKTQASVIEETGMDLLIPVTRMKRRIFFIFLTIALGYFIGELAVHYTFDMKEPFDFSSYSWFCFFHEVLEILTISAIFYLYRARDMGRFFTVEFDGRPGFRRILPFYEAKNECDEGVMLAVILPRNKIMIAKAD
jgi:hypothetical protein